MSKVSNKEAKNDKTRFRSEKVKNTKTKDTKKKETQKTRRIRILNHYHKDVKAGG